MSHNVGAFHAALSLAEGKPGEVVGYVMDKEIYQSPSAGPPHPNEGEMFEWACHGFGYLGNIVCEVFCFVHPKTSATDPPGSVVTDEQHVDGICKLQALRKLIVCTGNPELEEFEVAGLRASKTGDNSTGWDFQQAMLTVFPRFSRDEGAEKPFSIGQPMLVP